MSKPLELTWYEQDDDGDYIHPEGYFIPEMDVDDWTEWKRLTDAELAAEAWAAQCNRRVRNYDRTRDIPGVTWEWEHNIMARFATHPHYDEDSA